MEFRLHDIEFDMEGDYTNYAPPVARGYGYISDLNLDDMDENLRELIISEELNATPAERPPLDYYGCPGCDFLRIGIFFVYAFLILRTAIRIMEAPEREGTSS